MVKRVDGLREVWTDAGIQTICGTYRFEAATSLDSNESTALTKSEPDESAGSPRLPDLHTFNPPDWRRNCVPARARTVSSAASLVLFVVPPSSRPNIIEERRLLVD